MSQGANLVFRHALLRDGAYDGLTYRLRRELHGRVADFLLSAAGDDPEEWAHSLSLHYLSAQRFEEAWRYSLVAAEKARSVYANVEAAEFYERALTSARRLPAVGRARGRRGARGAGGCKAPYGRVRRRRLRIPRCRDASSVTTAWPRPGS